MHVAPLTRDFCVFRQRLWGAVDVGGPLREFLQLLVKAVNESSGIFAGSQ